MSDKAIVNETPATDAGSLYGAGYYAHYFGGVAYADAEHWTRFFGAVADMLVRDIAPKSVLDVGCAMGYLVEALRERGVEAWGFDVSEYAIENAQPAIRDYCWVGSIHDPLPRHYDLITCIEVVEHLPAEEAPHAFENLCAHSDDILFTSTPLDFGEETHFNVRPPEYWTELFAKQNFYRDVGFEAPDLAFWACRYRRNDAPFPRIVASYERALWHYRHAAYERDRLLTKQLGAVDENERLKADVDALRRALNDCERLRDSAAGRLALSLQARSLRLAPVGTWRQRGLRKTTNAIATLLEGLHGTSTSTGSHAQPRPLSTAHLVGHAPAEHESPAE
jgi:SAM-dependent methyltransferase